MPHLTDGSPRPKPCPKGNRGGAILPLAVQAIALAGEGGARVVLDRGDGFVALVPHAAEVPLEVWLAPERPEASLVLQPGFRC